MTDITTLAIAALSSVAMTILIMFLPAVIELKKPHDAGPRLIHDNSAQVAVRKVISIVNMEDDSKQESQVALAARNSGFTPNLERFGLKEQLGVFPLVFCQRNVPAWTTMD